MIAINVKHLRILFTKRFSLFILGLVLLLVSCASDVYLLKTKGMVDDCRPYENGKYIDEQEGHYCILTKRAWTSSPAPPANVPLDAIEYAISSFVGIPKSYVYFNQLCSGAKKAFLDYGVVEVYILYNQQYIFFDLLLYGPEKHLVVAINSIDRKFIANTAGAVDLNKVDLSIK